MTGDGIMRVKVGKKTVAEIPAKKLADEFFANFAKAVQG